MKRDVETRSDYDYVHRRCKELRPVFGLIREHRNRQQHRRSTPQTSQVLSLSGVVLHALDLAPPRFDKVVPARSDEVTRIRGQCHDAIEDVIEIMEAEHKSTSKKLAGAINDSENELKSAFQEETRELEQRLANIAEQVSAIRRAQRDHAASTVATSERPEPEVRPADAFVPDVMDSPAESALRKLRDRIREENENLEHWENICMMRPIVEEALQAAELGKLNTLDDWRQLPWVKRKFSDNEKRRKQEEQLKRYGEEMMRIYARVRRRSARSVAG